jgi:hypothetical protein
LNKPYNDYNAADGSGGGDGDNNDDFDNDIPVNASLRIIVCSCLKNIAHE